jgi:peptidoglycan/LPS O-acetylase OafA/YrhL
MRRDNNFDILRLIFAWMIVYSHCYALSLQPTLGRPVGYIYGLEGFFAISGCLIVASWERSKSLTVYLKRRAQRILPAYIFSIGFCLVTGSFFTTLPLLAFWKSAATWKYIVANLCFVGFLHDDLPGVFAKNPIHAMNGALWTIKIEVGFYLLVPLLVWLVRRIGPAWALGSVFVLSVAYKTALHLSGHETLSHQLPGELSYFMVGAAVFYYFREFNEHRRLMWTISLPSMALLLFSGSALLLAIALPLFTLCVAFLLPPYRGITKYGDFSYGTYVLHFPIIQCFVALGFFAKSPLLSVLCVVPVVAASSVFSWFFVERKFLMPARVKQQESQTTAEAV